VEELTAKWGEARHSGVGWILQLSVD